MGANPPGRRKHSKTCEAVLETSGWSPVAITKPCGLSFAMQLNKLVNIKVTYISFNTNPEN
jgi:hypothetical protein